MVDPIFAHPRLAAVYDTKAGAELVTWIEGDAAAIPAGTRADLVVMTGNAAQAVPEDREWSDGMELTPDSTLRFRDQEDVRASLDAAGFTVEDVRDAPDRPGREVVFIARRRPRRQEVVT